MDLENLEQQTSPNTTTIQPEIEVKKETETKVDDFLDFSSFINSEKEIKTSPKLEGLKQVESAIQNEDKVFSKKQDKTKMLLKKRLKIVTSVYVAIASLLLTFVGVNVATLVNLNKQITENTATIKAESELLSKIEIQNPEGVPDSSITISLNEPRDYSDDYKELTFLDKITILLRNIFG